jgi:hypothetical protein
VWAEVAVVAGAFAQDFLEMGLYQYLEAVKEAGNTIFGRTLRYNCGKFAAYCSS